jgi:hypothetical protein
MSTPTITITVPDGTSPVQFLRSRGYAVRSSNPRSKFPWCSVLVPGGHTHALVVERDKQVVSVQWSAKYQRGSRTFVDCEGWLPPVRTKPKRPASGKTWTVVLTHEQEHSSAFRTFGQFLANTTEGCTGRTFLGQRFEKQVTT